MKLNQKKDVVQQKALEAWIKEGKTGTCEIITGLGKTFISLHALYTMPQDDNVTHLFLAEATDRKKDLFDDIQKYNKIFLRDVLADYNLEFHCYQTAYKWKDREFGLVIADEIHDAIHNFKEEYIFNLWKWKDVIIKNYIISATFNEASKVPLSVSIPFGKYLLSTFLFASSGVRPFASPIESFIASVVS